MERSHSCGRRFISRSSDSSVGWGDVVFESLSFLDIYFQFLVVINSLANYLLRVNS